MLLDNNVYFNYMKKEEVTTNMKHVEVPNASREEFPQRHSLKHGQARYVPDVMDKDGKDMVHDRNAFNDENC